MAVRRPTRNGSPLRSLSVAKGAQLRAAGIDWAAYAEPGKSDDLDARRAISTASGRSEPSPFSKRCGMCSLRSLDAPTSVITISKTATSDHDEAGHLVDAQ